MIVKRAETDLLTTAPFAKDGSRERAKYRLKPIAAGSAKNWIPEAGQPALSLMHTSVLAEPGYQLVEAEVVGFI